MSCFCLDAICVDILLWRERPENNETSKDEVVTGVTRVGLYHGEIRAEWRAKPGRNGLNSAVGFISLDMGRGTATCRFASGQDGWIEMLAVSHI